ncbi:MAG: hypothetical protein COA92_05170 [Sulfurovum sp.]|nr:MAG: hypothetical protein COA92_05170 [Sulfurovum sp.]
MKTLFKKLIIVLILLALTLTGLFLFLFSPFGNNTLKPYVKNEIEEQLGMSVDISTFSIKSDNAKFIILVNKELSIEVVTNYSFLTQSFKGIYQVIADNFIYDEIKLRQANIIGRFEGTPSDISIDGNGTVLDAPLDYALRVINNIPQKIKANIQSIELAELLQLSAQPPLAKGKVNVKIDMPTIGEENAKGFGHIILDKATFNDALIKKLYNFELPKQSYVTAKVDATLNGKMIDLLADVKSNLFKMNVDNASINVETKKVLADYRIDVKDIRILTQNKLQGVFKINGDVKIEDEKVKVTGESKSFGGELLFNLGDKLIVTFKKIIVAKILHFMKQPALATGDLSGTVVLENTAMDAGNYEISVKNGKLNKKTIRQNLGYVIPENSVYSFDSKGKISNKKLQANATVYSSLANLTLSDIKVNMTNQYVNTDYTLQVHDVTIFMPVSKNAKKTKVNAQGTFAMTDHIVVTGSTTGLGEKLDFLYDSKTASLEAIGLYVARIMALSGLPVALKGRLDTKVKMTNLQTLAGTFSLKSSDMVTQPRAMKKLIGKALKTTVKIDSKGNIKKGKAYADTTIQTGLATVILKNTVLDIKKNLLNTDYRINVPDLKKLYVLTDQKFYGKLLVMGKVSKGESLKVTGVTQSLGGKITYTLQDDKLTSRINNVPIENILKMLGHKAFVLGKSFGNVNFSLKRNTGVVNLSIDSFKIRPSKLTRTVKLLLKKDPSRIIFKTTKFYANIKGDNITYTLTAKGKRALVKITSGKFNKAKNTNSANFTFVYEKTTVIGTIKGNVDNPQVSINPTSLMNDKMKRKLNNKIDGFLKGLKF